MGMKRKSIDVTGNSSSHTGRSKKLLISEPNERPHEAQKPIEEIPASKLPFDYRYIMAPMVGASELPFRLFCRKYGAQLCYTPMMMASEFANSKEYRQREFPTSVLDRPLVCHFGANDPQDFAKAAQLVAPHCDAIDLNLGCPQRTAYVGHFGSYLLDPKDRSLIIDIVKAGCRAVNIPIFVKIRLLDKYEETLELVRQLYEAGATLIAVHARYRATFHRKGPGARDGPALLDQIQQLKAEFPDKLMISNGNTITYDDVVKNLHETKADGIMSAEGILDNPALFFDRLKDLDSVPVQGGDFDFWRRREVQGAKLFSKFRKILKTEAKLRKESDNPSFQLSQKETKRLAKKSKVIARMGQLDKSIVSKNDSLTTAAIPLADLQRIAEDKPSLALEYLQWAKHYPTSMRTIIFHIRRILKVELGSYQLVDECLACRTIEEVERTIKKVVTYRSDPSSFRFDKRKAQQDKETLDRKREEEGKRKAYEARMFRKAKREGKDVEFYLRHGAVVPSAATVKDLSSLSRDKQLCLWKDRDHSQHCMAFHLGNCQRGRACAFLHMAPTTSNTFEESDEVAG